MHNTGYSPFPAPLLALFLPVSHFLSQQVYWVAPAGVLMSALGTLAQTRCCSLVQNQSWGKQCSRQAPEPRALGLYQPCWLPQMVLLGDEHLNYG